MFGFESGKPVFFDKHLNHREQVEPLISLYQDGEATPQEQRTVEFYLERCAECRALYAAFNKIQLDLGEVLATTPAPHLDPGFYRQTPFYQANQRKQTFESNAQTNTRPFVNAVSPVISGGNSGMPRRASFAASFSGLAAAIALLVGVGVLLFFSINSLNNNNPVPTVAQVASNISTAAESPSATTAPATDTVNTSETPQSTNSSGTTASAKTTTSGNSTPTPKNSGGTKTTSANSTTTRGQGGATTTTPPAVKTTTKAASNATTTVASVVTTPPLNTVAAATTQPNTVATSINAATTSTTDAATTSSTTSTTTLNATTTTTSGPATITTESPTVTPAFSTPPVENDTPTATISSNISIIAGGAIVTPTVTPAFPEPTSASDISTTVVATPTLSTTVASSPVVTASAAVSTTIAATDTISATTTITATTVAATTPAISTAAPTVTATTTPPTTAPALISAPGLIAYVSTQDGEIHLMHSDGSSDYAFTNGTASSIIWSQLVWSPDARWLAAVGKTRNNGVYSIYTLDTQSSHPDITPVANGIAPAWAPNSRLLAYLAESKLDSNGVRVGKSAVLDLKHSVTTELDNSYTGFGPQWFPDGQRLLAGQNNIYQLSPDATARTFDVTLVQRIKLAFTNTCLATSLSPNGTQLASLENATNGSLLLVYYDLTRNDAPRIPISIISGFNNTIRAGHNCGTLRLSWTPSGHSIYFYAQSGNSFYNVLESVSTGEVSYLTNIYAPSFTQDGAYLVDFDPTTSQVYALSSSVNSRPANVPVIGSAEFAPSWQPVYK